MVYEQGMLDEIVHASLMAGQRELFISDYPDRFPSDFYSSLFTVLDNYGIYVSEYKDYMTNKLRNIEVEW